MKSWEIEFLKLAGVWLGCQFNIMGGDLTSRFGHRPVRNMHDLGWAMLGAVDYAAEMREIIRERDRSRHQNKEVPGFIFPDALRFPYGKHKKDAQDQKGCGQEDHQEGSEVARGPAS